MGRKDWSLELVGCLKVVDNRNGSEAHDPDLYALGRQRISDELLLEDCEASIELRDRPACH